MPSKLSKRAEIFARVEQRLEAFQRGFRQNLGLIAPRGFGKTWVAAQMAQRLGRIPGIACLYIDCSFSDPAALSDRWVHALLRALAPAGSLEKPEASPALVLAELEKIYPRTVEKIRHLQRTHRRSEKPSVFMRELFSLTGLLTEESGKKAVLILDEFQALEALPLPHPFELLGRQILVDKNTLYWVLSSRPAAARAIFHEKLSLLFGNFEVLELAPFDFEESAQFLESRLPGRLFSEPQKKMLIQLTGGSPLYLQLLTEHWAESQVVRAAGDSEHEAMACALGSREVFEALQKELCDEYGRLAQLFTRTLEQSLGALKEPALHFRALLALSGGIRKVQALALTLECKLSECKKILQRLVQDELVSRRGVFYLLDDSLFAFWLKEVLSRRLAAGMDRLSIQTQFGDVCRGLLEQLQSDSAANLLERLQDLFQVFRGDRVQIGSKMITLPAFEETAVRPAGSGEPLFYAQAPGVRWVCRFFKEQVREDDVTLFIEETKKLRAKKLVRLLAAPAGIEQNAKLIAQEAGLHLWNLEDLNLLFAFYNLPKLIWIRKSDGSTLGALAQSLHSS